MTWTCRKDGKERKKISSLSYRLMIPRAMLSYARLSASARLGSEPMRQGIMRALVPTPAKPGRYQSWTRAFLPSMVFKKNKKNPSGSQIILHIDSDDTDDSQEFYKKS